MAAMRISIALICPDISGIYILYTTTPIFELHAFLLSFSSTCLIRDLAPLGHLLIVPFCHIGLCFNFTSSLFYFTSDTSMLHCHGLIPIMPFYTIQRSSLPRSEDSTYITFPWGLKVRSRLRLWVPFLNSLAGPWFAVSRGFVSSF